MWRNLAQLSGGGGGQFREPFNMVPLNSASKYMEELGPIKWDAQLSRDQIKWDRLYVEPMFVIVLLLMRNVNGTHFSRHKYSHQH